MNQIVIAFAGSPGSGKTVLSDGVSRVLHWPRLSFGDYVRQVARSRGLNESREVLQQVGASLVENSVDELCRAVLSQVNWNPGQSLIIDGVRHVEVLITLRELVAPSVVRLVFVATDDSTRLSRLVNERKSDESYLERLDGHSTELQVKTKLAELADIIVDGSEPEEALLHSIITAIQQWQRNAPAT